MSYVLYENGDTKVVRAACYAPGATAGELAEMRRYYGDHG